MGRIDEPHTRRSSQVKECSKSIARRLADPDFGHRYFVGEGLDVGGKPDPLAVYAELFSRVTAIRTWDVEDGDGQLLAGVADESFDFVHSSHCLEHLADPRVALHNWLRVLRPGGHLVFTVPDEDLYEQGVFPSGFNRGHRHTFTIFKASSWSPASINLLDLLRQLGEAAQVVKIELLQRGYRFGLPRYDQTLTPVAESGIEVVVRKRLESEITQGGRLPSAKANLSRETRIQLNQYRDDAARMKRDNAENPPFNNDAEL